MRAPLVAVEREAYHQARSSSRSFEITCVDMWLDVGAHIGVFTSLALAAGADVVSVEPDKHNFAILEKNSVRRVG